MTPEEAAEPDETRAVAYMGGARWEIVDAHRCTACGHLDTDGYRMVDHLRTHGPLPTDDWSYRCSICGWRTSDSRVEGHHCEGPTDAKCCMVGCGKPLAAESTVYCEHHDDVETDDDGVPVAAQPTDHASSQAGPVVIALLLVWCVLSVPTGLLLGAVIARRDLEEAPRPERTERAA